MRHGAELVDLRQLDPPTMAAQLRKPEGEVGLALADSMAERNWPVYEAAFNRLGVKPGDRLFEVGFGNGKLVPKLLALGTGLTFAGIDFSETMVARAEAFNSALIESAQAVFRLASVEAIPFDDASFDRALTINTVYFWPDPVRALAEIRRVLRPDGVLLLGASAPEDLARNAYTCHGFRDYGAAALTDLHRQAGFARVSIEIFRDSAPTLDRSGSIEREMQFVNSALR